MQIMIKDRLYFVNERLYFLVVGIRYTSPGGLMYLVSDGNAHFLASISRKSQIVPEIKIPEAKRIKKDIGTIVTQIDAGQKYPASPFKAYFVSDNSFRTDEAGIVIGLGVIDIAEHKLIYYVLYGDGSIISVSEDAEKRMFPEFRIPSNYRLSW